MKKPRKEKSPSGLAKKGPLLLVPTLPDNVVACPPLLPKVPGLHSRRDSATVLAGDPSASSKVVLPAHVMPDTCEVTTQIQEEQKLNRHTAKSVLELLPAGAIAGLPYVKGDSVDIKTTKAVLGSLPADAVAGLPTFDVEMDSAKIKTTKCVAGLPTNGIEVDSAKIKEAGGVGMPATGEFAAASKPLDLGAEADSILLDKAPSNTTQTTKYVAGLPTTGVEVDSAKIKEAGGVGMPATGEFAAASKSLDLGAEKLTALEVLRAVAADEATKPTYGPATEVQSDISPFSPAGCVTTTMKQIKALDGFGYSPQYLRKGFRSKEEQQDAFDAGIRFSQSFREAHNNEYPCPGTVVYLLGQCNEQVDQRTLTRAAGYQMLRKHFAKDANAVELVRLLVDYQVPLEEVKKLSSKAISRTVRSLLYGSNADNVGVKRKMEEMADDELPFNRTS